MVGLQGSVRRPTLPSLPSPSNRARPAPRGGDVYSVPRSRHQLQSLGRQINIPVFDQARQNPRRDLGGRPRFARSVATTRSSLTPPDGSRSTEHDGGARWGQAPCGPDRDPLVADAIPGKRRLALPIRSMTACVTGLILTKIDGDAQCVSRALDPPSRVPISSSVPAREVVTPLSPSIPGPPGHPDPGHGRYRLAVERAQVADRREGGYPPSGPHFRASSTSRTSLSRCRRSRDGSAQSDPRNDPRDRLTALASQAEISDKDMGQVEAIIRSMTPQSAGARS
jgi:hypothetical protein